MKRPAKLTLNTWIWLLLSGYFLAKFVLSDNEFLRCVSFGALMTYAIALWKRKKGEHASTIWALPGAVAVSQLHFILRGDMSQHKSATHALFHGSFTGVAIVIALYVIGTNGSHIYDYLKWKLTSWLRSSRLATRKKLITVHQSNCRTPAIPKANSVVTLVHGTFAREAPWTKEGSKLRNVVIQALGVDAKFSAFEWSGENSHAARIKAGEELGKLLKISINKFPGSAQFIISHSHGGNVALYALKDPAFDGKISGIVTLATPFISLRRRNVGEVVGVLSWIFPILIFVLLGPGLFIISIEYRQTWLFFIGLFSPIFFVYFGWHKVRRWLHGTVLSWARNTQGKIIARLSIGAKPVAPILFAFVSFDEAGLLLTVLHRLGSVGHFLLLVCQRALVFACIANLVVLVIAVISDGHYDGRTDLVNLAVVNAVSFISSLIFALLISLIVANVWPYLIRAHSMGFGGETFVDNFLMDIGVTNKPPFDTDCYPCPVEIRKFEGLRHSAAYTNIMCLSQMGDWMAGKSPSKHQESQSNSFKPALWRILESGIAGALVILVLLSQLPTFFDHLTAAERPTSWDRRHPELVINIAYRKSLTRAGNLEIPKHPATIKIDFNAPSGGCFVSGFYKTAEPPNIAILRLPEEVVANFRNERYSVVDVSLHKAGDYRLVLGLTATRSGKMETDLEIVCPSAKPVAG
jgi:hypothetical protein